MTVGRGVRPVSFICVFPEKKLLFTRGTGKPC